jgi:hypothetical protein
MFESEKLKLLSDSPLCLKRREQSPKSPLSLEKERVRESLMFYV